MMRYFHSAKPDAVCFAAQLGHLPPSISSGVYLSQADMNPVAYIAQNRAPSIHRLLTYLVWWAMAIFDASSIASYAAAESRRRKEDFVTNLSGTSKTEIFLLSACLPLLICAGQLHCRV